MKKMLVATFACLGIGCGGAATKELRVVPGHNRSQAESALRKSNYCRGDAATHKLQRYGRCGVKGFETGESWVAVDYNKQGEVVRARRMERFGSHREAVDRWSNLWEAKKEKLGKSSAQARTELGSMGETPEGAVTWKVWFSSNESHLIGLYLVKPSDPNSPQVIEVVRAR